MALEGFTIRAEGGDIRIESPTGRGALYGCFRLLSLLQTGRLRPEELPRLDYRHFFHRSSHDPSLSFPWF